MVVAELQYEEAAEYLTDIKGWVCVKCKRYWGEDEHMARYCCTRTSICDCGEKCKYGWAICETCRARRDEEKYAKAKRVEWNGETPLALWDTDTFFWDVQALEDYLWDESLLLKDVRLALCVPGKPRVFEMHDFLCDSLPENVDELPGDWKNVEKAVNDYIEKHAPRCWWAGNEVPTYDSVAAHLSDKVLVERTDENGP